VPWGGTAHGETVRRCFGQQGQGSGGSKHSSCSLFACTLFPLFVTAYLFSPRCLIFQVFLFSFPPLLTLKVLPPPALPALSIQPHCQTSSGPRVSIPQRQREAPARPSRPHSQWQRASSLSHGRPLPGATKSPQPGSQRSTRPLS